MRLRRRDIVTLIVAVLGVAGYVGWKQWRKGRYELTPPELAKFIGLRSTPDTLRVEACRELVHHCAEDFMVHACVGTIAPGEFPRLLEAGRPSDTGATGKSHELLGMEVGEPFDVAATYQMITADSPDHLQLPMRGGYGDLFVYTNAARNRFAIRMRTLVVVECP